MATVEYVPLGQWSDDEELHANVRRVVTMLMKSRGIEAETLADTVGIGRSSVYTRLNGRSRFQLQELYRLARYFGVTFETFLIPAEELIRTRHPVVASLQDYEPGEPLPAVA